MIVLDDVVTTIDASHREKICLLLLEEFIENQLVITTHDGIWFEQLRANQRAFRKEGNFKNIRITSWSREIGPIIRPYKPIWEKIESEIEQSEKRNAGRDGRYYLEWVLEEIVYKILVPIVPKRAGGFNVIDLLQPTMKRLRELLLEGKFKEEVFNSFRSLESTIIMGNLLSHNNTLAENVSLDEVKRFCNSVYNLHQNYLCPECGKFITYLQELKILRCSGRNCEKPLEIRVK